MKVTIFLILTMALGIGLVVFGMTPSSRSQINTEIQEAVAEAKPIEIVESETATDPPAISVETARQEPKMAVFTKEQNQAWTEIANAYNDPENPTPQAGTPPRNSDQRPFYLEDDY